VKNSRSSTSCSIPREIDDAGNHVFDILLFVRSRGEVANFAGASEVVAVLRHVKRFLQTLVRLAESRTTRYLDALHSSP
jgi:hypothetical protein